jgi:type IV pilus assembly protein PilV
MKPAGTIAGVPGCRQRGYTLIDVMVAFLVMAIGLLGTAYMQTRSVQYGNESQNRSQINIVVSEMIDRMRSNMIRASSASSNLYTATITATEMLTDQNQCAVTSPVTLPITASPRNDAICFLKNLATKVPLSNMQITAVDLDGDTNVDNYRITVYWSDQQLSQGNLDEDSDEGKTQESDCSGLNRTWSGTLTWWDAADITDPEVCLVSHSWQFEVPIR